MRIPVISPKPKISNTVLNPKQKMLIVLKILILREMKLSLKRQKYQDFVRKVASSFNL